MTINISNYSGQFRYQIIKSKNIGY